MKNQPVSIHNIADGHANTLFDLELQKVMQNFYDESTSLSKDREITLKFKFSAKVEGFAGDRAEKIKGMVVSISSSCSLAKSETPGYNAFIKINTEGMPELVRFDPEQIDAFENYSQLTTAKEL